MAESKLDAARRSGSLTNVIGAMREEQASQQSTAASGREQVDIVDGSIRLAAHLTEQGKTGVERRRVLSGVQVGTTVTSKGAAKTLLSRAEKIERVKTWASAMTEEQRTEYMIGEKYGALSENAQTVIAEAFDELDSRAEEDALGVANYDLNGELPDVDAIVGDEDDGDVIEYHEGNPNYDEHFDSAAWEAEQTP